ncbi:MAG TPA: hypothetical protein VJX67_05595 [Blastocatellia bacterium]|nr:hypothetical protein [Blastocatellia bacterium]
MPVTRALREQAVLRGLDFIYGTAQAPENFKLYGFDYLYSFYCISATSLDARLRSLSRTMGRERARQWRAENSSLPDEIDADIIAEFAFASLSADRLGIRDSALKHELRKAARRFAPPDYFWFDPATEPPPTNVPKECPCGAVSARGSSVCGRCAQPLDLMSRYEVWLVALIRSYIGERYGVTLGTPYQDVIKWLPQMRPYCGAASGLTDDFIWSLYAVTHIVYTLSDYCLSRLSPDWLPVEFQYLAQNLPQAISTDDAEMVGELLDSLKSFGLTAKHRLVREGREYLLSAQNRDGSWGDVDTDDIYARYHPTLTAVNGLRDHAWKGPRLSFPRLKPVLERWAASTG